MLLIIIGILISVFSFVYFGKQTYNVQTVIWDSFKEISCVILGLFVIAVGFGIPMHGFNEPVIADEYELVEIVDGSNVYVVEDEDRTPFFKYVKTSSESRISDPYDCSNIEIVISDKYEKPTLVKYKRKPERSVLTFAVFGNGYDYKIYAAEENIKRLK